MPLEISTTVPTGLRTKDALEVRVAQPIQVVFNRAVIALGSDFPELPADKTPFRLIRLDTGEPLEGRARWASTYIFRWDPEGTWATDLQVRLEWNSELTTWDGVPLSAVPSSVELRSPSLKMDLVEIRSDVASNLTDKLWDAWTGTVQDELPEVPNDAVLRIQFSHPVDVDILAGVIRIDQAVSDDGEGRRPGAAPEWTTTVIRLEFAACEKGLPPRNVSSFSEPPPPRKKEPTLENVSSCVEMRITQGRLAPNTRYSLHMPLNAAYHPAAGTLRDEDLRVELNGLRLFRLPFYIELAPVGTSSQRFDIWLPHGLNSEVELADLKAALRVEEVGEDSEEARAALEFELQRVSRGRLRLLAEVLPGRSYRITSAPARVPEARRPVRDGFGLALMASSIQLQASPVEFLHSAAYIDYRGFTQLEAGQDYGAFWPVLVAGRKQNEWEADETRAWPLTNMAEDLAAALSSTGGFSAPKLQETVLGAAPLLARNDGAQRVQRELQLQQLLASTGVFVMQTCCSYDEPQDTTLVMRSSVASAAITHRGVATWLWVTDLASGRPLQGVEVQLWVVERVGSEASALGRPLITDAMGLVRLPEPLPEQGEEPVFGARTEPLRLDRASVYAVLTNPAAPGTLTLQPVEGRDLLAERSTADTLQGQLVLDRGFARPGEALMVKGYAQDNNFAQRTLPELHPDDRLYLEYDVSTGGDFLQQVVDVQLDERFGSFDAELPLPDDADPGVFNVRLVHQPAKELDLPLRVLDRESFTVADPRPPTVELTVDAPRWVKPDAPALTATAVAESFVGSSVEGADISVVFTRRRARALLEEEEEEDPYEQSLTVFTDATGRAEARIDLASIEPMLADGDTWTLTFTWIGPTRERVVRVAEGAVAVSDLSLNLQFSMDPDNRPGFAARLGLQVSDRFGGDAAAAADLVAEARVYRRLLTDAEVESLVGSIPVTRPYYDTLPRPEPVFSPENFTAGEVVCGRGTLAEDPRDGCLVEPLLEDVGVYLIGACLEDRANGGVVVCDGMLKGKSLKQWEEAPLARHFPDQGVSVKAISKQSAELIIDTPYQGTWALLTWGNSRETEVRTLPVSPGMPIGLDLGAECDGGCAMHITLMVPRQRLETVAPVPVPTSRLFDAAAPHIWTTVQSIKLPEDEEDARELRPSVAVQESSPGGVQLEDGEVPVVAPGDNVTMSLSVSSCLEEDCMPVEAASEVTLVIVDKAILQLKPYPLQKVDFGVTFAGEFSSQTALRNLVAPGALSSVVDVYEERIAADPWQSLDPLIQANRWSDIDMSLERVLNLSASEITPFPFNGGGFYGPVRSEPIGVVRSGRAGLPASASALALGADVADENTALDAKSEEEAAEAAPASAASTVGVRLEADFVPTPVFDVITVAAGENGIINFPAPSKLGSFVVRAYAMSAELEFGAAESELIVRRTVSLTPSEPRIVRLGDRFEAGVVVTATGAAAEAVEVEVRMALPGGAANPLLVQQPAVTQQTVVLGGEEPVQKEVRFRFEAISLGEAAMRFEALMVGDDSAKDALQLSVPVLGVQDPVTLASSFAIQASDSGEKWVEGINLTQLDPAPGSGSLTILAGVGRLAALEGLTSSLASTEPEVAYGAPFAQWSLAALVPHYVLSKYDDSSEQPDTTTPPEMQPQLSTVDTAAPPEPEAQAQQELQQEEVAGFSAQTEEGSRERANDAASPVPSANRGRLTSTVGTLLDTAFLMLDIGGEDLAALTDPRLGLLPWLNYWTSLSGEREVFTQLNAYASWIVDEACRGSAGTCRLCAAPGRVCSLQTTWQERLAAQLEADAVAARSDRIPEPYGDLTTLAWARLALGSDWQPSRSAGSQIAADLSFERLLRSVDSGSITDVETQAVVALTLVNEGAEYGEDANLTAILDAFQTQTRVQGRSAYISAHEGSAAAASTAGNAMALLAKVRAGQRGPLIEKLATYLGGALGAAGESSVTAGDSETAKLLLALAEYDQATESTDVELNLRVVSGETELLNADFLSATDGVVNASIPWSQLATPPQPLEFFATGSGEVTLAATLVFAPSKVLEFPQYRGLQVSYIIQAVNGSELQAVGPALAQVPLGSTVRLTAVLTSVDDLRDVALQVPMPGGLEPQDPNLAPDLQGPVCPLPPFASLWWPWPCPSQLTLPEAVTFRFPQLRAGAQEVSFVAVAATAGEFVVPAAHAWVEEQPEVMGMSQGGSITVCNPNQADCVAEGAVAEPAVSKACPDNCNNNGACNTKEGKCICNPYFAGESCSEFLQSAS